MDPTQYEIPQTPRSLMILALLFVPGLYVVLAFSAGLILAIGGGVVYGVYYIFTHLSKYLAFRIGIVASLIAIGAIIGLISVLLGLIRAVFKGVPFAPAVVFPLRRERRLHALVNDLSQRVGARVPDSLLLSGEPRFAVMQGKLHVFNGTTRGRILVIGVPLLGALTVNKMRAIWTSPEKVDTFVNVERVSLDGKEIHRGVQGGGGTIGAVGGGERGADRPGSGRERQHIVGLDEGVLSEAQRAGVGAEGRRDAGGGERAA
jgi:hypothetical protein